MNYSIPKEVLQALKTLQNVGFEAFIVGGCVRDLLRGVTPSDWDVTTNATPEEIQKLFPDSVYENTFGTVGVKTKSNDARLKIIEVTPYRVESAYSDRRHPDKVTFTKNLEDDLARRDFTVNAIALSITKDKTQQIVDPYNGQEDLQNRIIRAVGTPKDRFSEDALRLLRAVRLATVLEFSIETKTKQAIVAGSQNLKFIAHERIRDEFTKLLLADHPDKGLELLRELRLLSIVAPELEEGVGVEQNLHHIYTVWEHNVRALGCAASEGWSLEVRMAALFHDVAKPQTKKGSGKYATFYGHDVVGARMTARALWRLRYPKDIVEKVVKLVRYHLFYYNVDEVTASSVRRLIRKVGPEDMEDLIRVRICDRIGSGVPKAEPYKLRHFRFMVEKLQRDPVSVGMLKVRGEDVMKMCGIPPSPRVGFLLNILLEDVLDDPKRNTKKYLLARLKALCKMSEKELQKLAGDAKKKSSALEEEEVGKIKKRHFVR